MKLKKLFLIISLCASVALHAEITNTIMHENANDGDTHGWVIYDAYPSGAKIENINDAQRGKVIKFTGRELKNGVDFLRWNDDNNLIQWKMKSNVWGAFYVVIQTSKGFRYLTYSPRDYDKGIGTSQKYKIRFGLGTKMRDGEWHTFTRDVKADLKKFEPDNEYLYIQGIKFRGTASFDDIKTMRETAIPSTKKEIFIIGPSTVNIGEGWNDNRVLTCGATNPENILVGWGERLQNYSKSKVYNFARAGANPIEFDENKDYNKTLLGENQNWDSTYHAMQKAPKGSFLLIQFGAHSKNMNYQVFENKIKQYINSAKNLNLIPVLLSSVDTHKNNTAPRDVKIMMNTVHNNPDVLFLDLVNKTNSEFAKLNQNELYRFGDCQHTYKNSTDKDPVHLSPIGANIVAGWVKDLACESNRADGQELCSQFK